MTLGCEDIGVWRSEFVAKTQLLYKCPTLNIKIKIHRNPHKISVLESVRFRQLLNRPSFFLPHQLTCTFFVALDIYNIQFKMQRACFFNLRSRNWQNTAQERAYLGIRWSTFTMIIKTVILLSTLILI